MITRTAIFEGWVRPGFEDRFFGEIRERLVQLWTQFPNACNLRLLRIVAADDDALPVAIIQQIDYPSMAALESAVASPIRAQARAIMLEIMDMFDGRFYHVISDGNLAEAAVELCD